MNDRELIDELCGRLGTGRLDPGYILPVLRDLGRSATSRRTTADLIEALDAHGGEVYAGLAQHLKAKRRAEAGRCHLMKKAGGSLSDFREALGDLPLDAPVGWSTASGRLGGLRDALTLLREASYSPAAAEADPRLKDAFARSAGLVDPVALIDILARAGSFSELREPLARLRATLAQGKDAWMTEDAAVAANLESFRKGDAAGRRQAFDRASAWPTSRGAELLREMAELDLSLRERAVLVVALRHNERTAREWEGCSAWLKRVERDDAVALAQARELSERWALELLFLWSMSRAVVDASLRARLAALCLKIVPEPPRPAAAPGPAGTGESFRAPPPQPPSPPQPPRPSVWDEHLLPLFAANWTMLTGIALVVVGSSLLAYYTWDKHWFFRYTLLPLLLAGFTSTLARLAGWMEGRDRALKGAADMLRGASIALLPVNFMAVALLASDPQVSAKAVLFPVYALAYLVVGGAGLLRCCGAVHPSLRGLLGPTLLAVNALVLLGPAAQLMDPSAEKLWGLLAAGFYAGFALVAVAVVRFLNQTLTPAMIEEGRVPWFFGLTLTTTYLQVFLWVHSLLRHMPEAHTYACMAVAAGGLVMFTERTPLIRRPDDPVYGQNSFLGYALILLGLFMGFAQPQVRSMSFLLAGGVWLAQAVARAETRHAWIAFTLLALGGGSVATWPGFPAPWIPALLVGLALSMEGAGLVVRLWARLDSVAGGMQALLLNAATVAGVLVFWRTQTPPYHVAALLVVNAALLARRAYLDDKLRHVHASALTAALALPYLGFADVSGRTLSGNTLVFGLGLLSLAWLGLTRVRPEGPVRRARSSVLVGYGSLATAAIALRVAFEQGRPLDALGLHAALSFAGPPLLAVALVAATYHARSWVPLGLASIIGFVLLPELKDEIRVWLPFISWGSGLASAACALALTACAFPIRSSEALKDLDAGDELAPGIPFPLKRTDYTLFTAPLLASAVFLLLKVDARLVPALLYGETSPKTAAAFILAGAAWSALAAYRRATPHAVALGHLGWISAVAGLVLAHGNLAGAAGPTDALLVAAASLTGLHLFYRHVLARAYPWADELFAAPTREVLRVGSVALAAASLLGPSNAYLMAFSASLLCWFGLAGGGPVYGSLLFLQGWVAAGVWTAQPAEPRLWLGLGLLGTFAILEAWPEADERLRPLTKPVNGWVSAAAFASGCWAVHSIVAYGSHGSYASVEPAAAWLGVALALAAARAQAFAPLALVGFALAYVQLLAGGLPSSEGWELRGPALTAPVMLASFSLAVAVLGEAGRRAHSNWPRALASANALEALRMPSLPWIHGAALGVGACAVAGHAGDPALRATAVQLATPYLAAAAACVASASWPRSGLYSAAAAFLTVGNILSVRFFAGDWLHAQGLMNNHLICLGSAATLVGAWALRASIEDAGLRTFLDRLGLAVAGFILALLTSTYFLRPDLETMTGTRFLVSAALTYLAGLRFRRAARSPNGWEASYARVWEGGWHYAVITSLWCLALVFPALRHPYASFPALALPVLYFYLRAELGDPRVPKIAGYRETAGSLSFFLLLLYAFRGAFQSVTFPQAELGLEHYHVNAPFVFLLSLVMLRLHALGGTPWLAYYGGLGLMLGSYFAITSLPGLSPFTSPIPSAWWAIALGHFWMVFSGQDSPARAAMQRLAGIDDELWLLWRRSWGLLLLVATQAGLVWGLSHWPQGPEMAAPLLVGGASLLAHQCWLRRSRALYALALVEWLFALHAGFLVPAGLPGGLVPWATLATWAALWAWSEASRESHLIEPSAVALGSITLVHVVAVGSGSPQGLALFASAAALLALTPRPSREPADASERMIARMVLFAPAVLVCLWRYPAGPIPCLLSSSAALLFIGAAAGWVQRSRRHEGRPEGRARVHDQALALLESEGGTLENVLLFVSTAGVAYATAARYGSPLAPAELGLTLALWSGCAASWWAEARRRTSMGAYVAAQLCAFGLAVAVRRQLMLHFGAWSYEYDVWASLAVSSIVAGARQASPEMPRELRVPLTGTLLLMPAAALGWVAYQGLGTDAALLVVGLNSLIFASMGKDDRESPYHVLATAGVVSFVCMIFWSKLGLRTAQAYVIPVGAGILGLVQLFRDKIAPEVRDQVRALTLTAMLGSSAYYALADDRYPLAFHMTTLLVAVASMSAGSLLRVRLYVLLGFAGLSVDLAALVYKVLIHMDRSTRMTLIGSQVLILGAVLIGGAVVYKTNQEKIDAALEDWRRRLAAWE